GSAPLHQHGLLVREITGELVALAHEFAARTVERQQPLGNVAAANAMNDAQGLGARTAHVGEYADIVTRGQRLVHAREPFGGLGAESYTRTQQERERGKTCD